MQILRKTAIGIQSRDRQELFKRKRQHLNLNIASGQERSKIAGEHIRIRTGDIDVHIRLDIHTIHNLFKSRDFLDLIQKDVGRFPDNQPFFQISVELFIVQQFFIFQLFKVHGHNLRILHAILYEPCLILRQQRGFSAAADSSHNFDDLFIPPLDQLRKIFLSFYQYSHLPKEVFSL